MSRFRMVLPLLVLLSLLLTLTSGCSRGNDFNSRVNEITSPYSFSVFNWEVKAVAGMVEDIIHDGAAVSDNTGAVRAYFDNMQSISGLQSAIARAGSTSDRSSLEKQISLLQHNNNGLSQRAVGQIEAQLRRAYSQAGIDNPLDSYISSGFGFPPIEAVLASPPNLLVISPRDHIEMIDQVTLVPEMTLEQKEQVEAAVEKLGYSALIVPLGGMATYPSYVTNDAGLKFTIESIAHEWLHQYLAFTPLGFRYVLDRLGVIHDYDIVTMNETVVSIVSKEIGDEVYARYYAPAAAPAPPAPPTAPAFDYNKVMRETRTKVDALLAAGQIGQAEQYMEQQRQYLAAHGYYIRKLNQAYFAFYGTYADTPSSVSPIGADLKALRAESPSLKDFLDTVSRMTNPQQLQNAVQAAGQ